MAEIVNLRTVRKRKARAEQADQAAENRVKFGRTKAEKDLAAAKAVQADRKIDGHKREE